MGVGFLEGASYPNNTSHTNHFFSVLPPERLQKSSPQSFWNWPLVFSYFSLGRFLILLFLLMSDNVHPNPGPVFACSMCAGNVVVVRMKIQNEGSFFSHLWVGSSHCMRPLLPLGAGFWGQTMTKSLVWSVVPQLQLNDDLKSHLDKQ